MEEQSLHEIRQTRDEKIVDIMSKAISKTLQETMTAYELEEMK